MKYMNYMKDSKVARVFQFENEDWRQLCLNLINKIEKSYAKDKQAKRNFQIGTESFEKFLKDNSKGIADLYKDVQAYHAYHWFKDEIKKKGVVLNYRLMYDIILIHVMLQSSYLEVAFTDWNKKMEINEMVQAMDFAFYEISEILHLIISSKLLYEASIDGNFEFILKLDGLVALLNSIHLEILIYLSVINKTKLKDLIEEDRMYILERTNDVEEYIELAKNSEIEYSFIMQGKMINFCNGMKEIIEREA